MQNKTLKFSVDGNFITRIAREWFFIEHRSYQTVEDLLLSCLQGTNKTLEELKIIVQDILMGRAEFQGNSGDGSFNLVYLKDNLNEINIFSEYEKLLNKFNELKENLDNNTKKYLDLIECLEHWKDKKYLNVSEIEDEYIKQILLDIEKRYNITKDDEEIVYTAKARRTLLKNEFLESYIKAHTKEVKYGWLDPTGKFYEVGWGDHQHWVYLSIIYGRQENHGICYEDEECKPSDLSRYYDEYMKYCENDFSAITMGGDFLVSKGWILLHSPGQGIPVITDNAIRRLTKAQKEFLYDYYMELDEAKRAYELFETHN